MKKSLTIMTFLASMMTAGTVLADATPYSKITWFGCLTSIDRCYVSLDDPKGDVALHFPSQCKNGQIVFSVASNAGKSTYSLLLAAFLAGKPVSLWIADGCNPDSLQNPTFLWANVIP